MDDNGHAVPDGTTVQFSVFNGSADPGTASTRKGEAETNVVIYGDAYSYQPNVVITSGELEAGVRIRCMPDSGACPVSPGGDCGPLSPPPCDAPSPPGVMSPPCATPTPPLSPPPLSPPPCESVSPESVSPPCATPTPYPCNPSPGSGALSPPCDVPEGYTTFTMSIDCDVQSAGIQTNCDVPLGASGLDVAIVATNIGDVPHSFGAFNFNLHDSVNARLSPLPGIEPPLDGNPDFNNALAASWDCGPIIADTGEDGAASSVSVLWCYLTGDYEHHPVVAAGESVMLAVVHYGIPVDATAGSSELRLGFVAMYGGEPSFDELGSCDPELVQPIACGTATVNLIGSVTATPPAGTPTPSATTTPTPTPTPHP
jgi:hypothetical protein